MRISDWSSDVCSSDLDSKSRLEDLYLPYKPKRRTRAQIAREAGLEPLADGLLADPTRVPGDFAAAFVHADQGVADARAALEGARGNLIVERTSGGCGTGVSWRVDLGGGCNR